MSEKTISKRAATLSSPVMLLATENPKKNPSMAFTRFNALISACKDGATPTVEQLLKAGYRMDDVRHDSAHGFIAVGAKAIEKAKKQVEIDHAAKVEAARQLLATVDAK